MCSKIRLRIIVIEHTHSKNIQIKFHTNHETCADIFYSSIQLVVSLNLPHYRKVSLCAQLLFNMKNHSYCLICLCWMDFSYASEGLHCANGMAWHNRRWCEPKQPARQEEIERRIRPNSSIINHFDESWIKNRFHWKVISKTLIKVTVIRIKCLHFYNDIKFWLITTKYCSFFLSVFDWQNRERETREKKHKQQQS